MTVKVLHHSDSAMRDGITVDFVTGIYKETSGKRTARHANGFPIIGCWVELFIEDDFIDSRAFLCCEGSTIGMWDKRKGAFYTGGDEKLKWILE